MTRFQPEAVVRWLDELDCAVCALRLAWCPRRRSAGRRSAAMMGLVLVAAVLLLGPSAGI